MHGDGLHVEVLAGSKTACDDQLAPAVQQSSCESRSLRRTCEFNGDVGAASAGQIADLRSGVSVLGVDRMRRAELQGEFAASRKRVDGD